MLAETLKQQGLDIVTGGTDSHLLLVDLRPKRVTGKAAEASLERARITANKNAIPFDPEKPAITSGIRLGSPAATTRGFGAAEFREIGLMIDEVLEGLARSNDGTNDAAEQAVGARVQANSVRALPALRRTRPSTVPRHALPVLRPRRHPGEGQPSHRGQRRDPPPPLLRQLRPALHHDRARAACAN